MREVMSSLSEDDWYLSNMEDGLPHWASGFANGELYLGAQLCTKDGRKIGNAVITEIFYNEYLECDVYVIYTDFGNKSTLSRKEVSELFYPPKYIVRNYNKL